MPKLLNLKARVTSLSLASHELGELLREVDGIRFCRNVQKTPEDDPKENERRLAQLLEAVDRLLAL